MKLESKPKLWGKWQHTVYHDGSTIVNLAAGANKPWLWIESDSAIDEERQLASRILMAMSIADHLNGYARPAWFGDFERIAADDAVSLSGAVMCARGPLLRSGTNWRHDGSEEAAANRALLMDALGLPESRSLRT